jgi:type II secretory pathway pseudopilin PulG
MDSQRRSAGYTLIEVLFALGVMTTMAAATTPRILAALDEYTALGAVRYMSTRLQTTRLEALTRHANVAMRFVQVGDSYHYAAYADGNGDGVRAADIASGVDPKIQDDEQLSDQFAHVDFGTRPGLPAVDPASPPPGTDPIRFGVSDSAAFTPLGTATPGSLYIIGRRGTQYVVRVLGETGKTRILKFDAHLSEWKPL